ncbi:MAG TPA: sigma-54 dependent transcriptional regulator [Acidobacteriaceae bacterium]
MFHSLSVLLITSDQESIEIVTSVLHSEGHRVICVESAAELVARQNNRHHDAVLFDTSHQPLNKLYLLKALSETFDKDALWLLSPLGVSLWTMESERLGIRNGLKKPLQRHDIERFLAELSRSGGRHAVIDDSPLPMSSPTPTHLEELPGGRYFFAGCPAMKEIYETVRLLAPVDVPVLILGESGVGKDIVASLLHKHSLRSQESYIRVNCAALPSELLESELFGYEAGAFTGAIKSKPGKFDLAHKGTLLLDEIAEMSAPMQAKLLHVLQDGEFCRLGGRATTQVDVRVVAATNVNIESAMADRMFREDLFYRISTFTIEVPPLRNRREEIPFLVAEMLRRHAINFKLSPARVPPNLMTELQDYDWPGNLRELSNFVMRMLITHDPEAAVASLCSKSRKRIDTSAKPVELHDAQTHDSSSMPSIVRDLKGHTESRLIKDALDSSGWNRRHAALRLGISYRSLLYKIQFYQLADTRSSLHLHAS